MEVNVMQDILGKNDALADAMKADFAARRIFVLNLMGSPGSGKTTLMEATLRALSGEMRIAVIEGDLFTTKDADRIGACGVQVGTRFLVADECRVHPVYKERLIKASDIGTMVTGKSLGDAVRSLKTPFTKRFAKMEADPNVSADEIRAFGTGSVRKAVFDGDLTGGSFLAGEVAGMIRRREPAAAIVDDIIGGAEKLLARNLPFQNPLSF